MLRMQVHSYCVFQCLLSVHFTGYFNSLKHPQTVLTMDTSPVFPTSCNVWQTASKGDVPVVRSGTILMCHLISDHTVPVEKREEERAPASDATEGTVEE